MASQGPHLQEVMSPTPGPEAGVMNGTVRAGNPSPSQPAEPVRGENLQTTDATSGPSISTAGQSPSPQLPQEVRTGGDGTSGLDGSLGTTGACFTVTTGIRCGRDARFCNWNGPGLWSDYCAKWNSCFWSYGCARRTRANPFCS